MQAEEDAEFERASTETPPKLPKPGGSMIRKRTSRAERPPSTATATFIETGGS